MRYLAAILLILIAPAAIARGDSDQACATSAQQPEVINARVELQRTPEMLVKRLHLADLLLNASCFDEAIHVLEAGEATNPRSNLLQYRLTRARSMVKEKEYFEGIDKAEAAARLRRGMLRCTQLADLEACDNVLSVQPGNSEILVAKGNALMKAGKLDDAIAAFSQARQGSLDDTSIADKLRAAQSRRQSLHRACMEDSGDTALQACQTILIKGAANEFDLSVRIANLQQQSNQAPQALDSFIAANSLRPGDKSVALAILALLDSTKRMDGVALQARGSSLMTLGRASEAVAALRQAAGLAPGLPDIARQLAAAEAQMRQTPAAVVARTAATGKAADKIVEKVPDKVAEAAPRRTSFSNVEPASRSN